MQAKIFELLTALSPCPVILAYQNGVEPPKPFITYALRFEAMPEHMLSSVDSKGVEHIRTHINGTLELQCFGDNATAILRELSIKAQTQANRDKWELAGIALVNVGRISEMPFLDEAQNYCRRSVLELFLRYDAETTEQIDTIETVDIEHEINALTGKQTIGVHNGKN